MLELARAYRRLRGAERWEAIRNVAEDLLMRRAEGATQERLVAATAIPQLAQKRSMEPVAVNQSRGKRSRLLPWRRRVGP